MAFVDRLTDALSTAGMTQSELARRIGVGRATVSHWMRDRGLPERHRVAEIESVLGLAPGALASNDFAATPSASEHPQPLLTLRAQLGDERIGYLIHVDADRLRDGIDRLIKSELSGRGALP